MLEQRTSSRKRATPTRPNSRCRWRSPRLEPSAIAIRVDDPPRSRPRGDSRRSCPREVPPCTAPASVVGSPSARDSRESAEIRELVPACRIGRPGAPVKRRPPGRTSGGPAGRDRCDAWRLRRRPTGAPPGFLSTEETSRCVAAPQPGHTDRSPRGPVRSFCVCPSEPSSRLRSRPSNPRPPLPRARRASKREAVRSFTDSSRRAVPGSSSPEPRSASCGSARAA